MVETLHSFRMSRLSPAGKLARMVNEERLVSLFLKLCEIDAPSLQERESVAWTKGYLAQISGLEIHEDEGGKAIGGNANNLIARLPGNKPGAPRIFLSAHFDTVEPTAGLKIGERDGVFFSESDTILGADDKGGMAPAIEAVHRLAESGDPHGDVFLLLSCAEEIGLKGADAIQLDEWNLDFGYVLDTGPPVGSFVTRTATHDKLDIKIVGRPAHAGKDPEKGINAIQVMARAVDGMKLGRIDEETTANLGIVEGGTGTNVVCAEVRIKAEARSTSVEALDAQVEHMITRFEQAARDFGARVEIIHDRHYHSYTISESERVVQVAQAAARALGMEPTLRTTLGGSDANIFNAKGLPSIVVATAMEKIHTHEEQISRQGLIDTARLAYQICLEAAR